jgi:hypothetical protein
MVIARPMTIRRLGPSGSLKKKKSILEQMMAVAAKITKEIFFELKSMFVTSIIEAVDYIGKWSNAKYRLQPDCRSSLPRLS